MTSNLASRLMLREADVVERAHLSEEIAELSDLLASNPADNALRRGIALLNDRYGKMVLLQESDLLQADGTFSTFDASAAAWAFHNGDMTGHGTAGSGSAFSQAGENRSGRCGQCGMR